MTPGDPLARIRRYDDRLKAFVRVFDPPLARPGADGPTFAIKDLVDVQGVPTGGGARTPVAQAPVANAFVVDRLLEAGWIGLGKTHTVELAYGAWGSNHAVGTPFNPWDAAVHRAPGGSSSGSAVAVAARLCDAALGTDTGGSVRIPAALCGVVGLKPGRGLVSRIGVHPLSPSLDTVGTIAADVAGAARMLAAISALDGGEAARGPFDAEAALARHPAGLRVAAIRPVRLGEVEPEVMRLYRKALEALAATGVHVEPVTPPGAMDDSFFANGLIMAAEGWAAWGERIAEEAPLMDPWILRRFEAGREVGDSQLAAAYRRREHDMAAYQAWMAPFDAVVCPTCPMTAPPLATLDETLSPLSRLTRSANYLDLPAVSVPCGLSPEGLPVGFQILGRPQDEATVVALAATFERVSGWNGCAPDLAGFAR